MEQKKYTNIQRFKNDFAIAFEKDDDIVIQEKLDGANASFRYDEETGKLVAFSRRQPLDSENNLRGFYKYVQSLNADEYKDIPNYIVFGEWAISHTVKYRNDVMNKWYVFDIYDVKDENYLSQSDVKEFAKKHGLNYIHTFYEGKFPGWDYVKSYVGKSVYGEIGEGVVIKNQSKLRCSDSKYPSILKLVIENLCEVAKKNKVDKNKMHILNEAKEQAAQIVTKRRIEKIAYKLRDDGIDISDGNHLMKIMPKFVYEDCIKEEHEIVEKIGKVFGKYCAELTKQHINEIIYELNK